MISSGGQRRRISTGAALLAQNSLIILDEPTAGIDPVVSFHYLCRKFRNLVLARTRKFRMEYLKARRDIWSVLCAIRDETDTAIVLTSHLMSVTFCLLFLGRGSDSNSQALITMHWLFEISSF